MKNIRVFFSKTLSHCILKIYFSQQFAVRGITFAIYFRTLHTFLMQEEKKSSTNNKRSDSKGGKCQMPLDHFRHFCIHLDYQKRRPHSKHSRFLFAKQVHISDINFLSNIRLRESLPISKYFLSFD